MSEQESCGQSMNESFSQHVEVDVRALPSHPVPPPVIVPAILVRQQEAPLLKTCGLVEGQVTGRGEEMIIYINWRNKY